MATKNLDKLQTQIAALSAKADALLVKEVAGVVKRMQEAIRHYNLTPEQVFAGIDKSSRKGKSAAVKAVATKAPTQAAAPVRKARGTVKGSKAPIKYRDENGNVWSGRGSQPRWLTQAIAAGRPKSDFLVPSGYRDDKGNEWDGKGKQPRWLTEAIKSGQLKEAFAA